jgi:hypothetical protein
MMMMMMMKLAGILLFLSLVTTTSSTSSKTLRSRSKSSSAKASKKSFPKGSVHLCNDDDGTLDNLFQQCAATCSISSSSSSTDATNAPSASVPWFKQSIPWFKPRTASTNDEVVVTTTALDTMKPSCCEGGVTALHMIYHGVSGAELFANLDSLGASVSMVFPCGDEDAIKNSNDDTSAVRFANCERCFPTASSSCDPAMDWSTNVTVQSGDAVCVIVTDDSETKLPTNLPIYYKLPDNCTVVAANLRPSCSQPIYPPFGMLLGTCGGDGSPIVALSDGSSAASYLEFVNGATVQQQPGGATTTLLSDCDVSEGGEKPNNDHCCQGGVKYLMTRFNGGPSSPKAVLTNARRSRKVARQRGLSYRSYLPSPRSILHPSLRSYLPNRRIYLPSLRSYLPNRRIYLPSLQSYLRSFLPSLRSDLSHLRSVLPSLRPRWIPASNARLHDKTKHRSLLDLFAVMRTVGPR